MNCDTCNISEGTKLCSKCRNRRYCGVECQRKDWKNHKINCKDINEIIGNSVKNNFTALDIVNKVLTYIEAPSDDKYINILNVITISENLNNPNKDITLFAVFLGDKQLNETHQNFKTLFDNTPEADKLPIFMHRFIHKTKTHYKCLSVKPQCVGMRNSYKEQADKFKSDIRKLFPEKYGFDIKEFENSRFMLILKDQKLSIVDDETDYKRLVSLLPEDIIEI